MSLPVFPTTDDVLRAIDHSLDACFEVTDDQELNVIGGEYTLGQLLDFYSGYDPNKLELVDGIYEYPDPLYTERCIIRSLIAEIRRLRDEKEET